MRRASCDLVDEVELAEDGDGRLARVLVDGVDHTATSAAPPSRRRCRRCRPCPRSAHGPARPAARPCRGGRHRDGRPGHRHDRAARRRPEAVPRCLGRRARPAPRRGARPGPGRARRASRSSRRCAAATGSTRTRRSRRCASHPTRGSSPPTATRSRRPWRPSSGRSATRRPARAGPTVTMSDERATPVTPVVEGSAPGCRCSPGRRGPVSPALTRVRLEGAVDDIPREGPVIVASNHASNLDAVVLGSTLMPQLGRRFQWLGKKELFDWPIVGWIARNGGVHAVDRGAAESRPSGSRSGSSTRAMRCSCSRRARAAPTARCGRPATASRCSPCAPVRRSCRSASPGRTSAGRGAEAAASRRSRDGPCRLPVPPRRRAAARRRAPRREGRGHRHDHAPDRRRCCPHRSAATTPTAAPNVPEPDPVR